MEAKTPTESPKQRVLVARPDGRGALLSGGTNLGGPGRPPSAFRSKCRERSEESPEIWDRIQKGELKIGDQEPGFQDRMKAGDLLAKYGHGEAEISLELIKATTDVLKEKFEESGIVWTVDQWRAFGNALESRLGNVKVRE